MTNSNKTPSNKGTAQDGYSGGKGPISESGRSKVKNGYTGGSETTQTRGQESTTPPLPGKR